MRVELNGTDIYFDVDGVQLQPMNGRLVERPTLIALHGGLGLDHGYLKPGLTPLRDFAQLIYVDLRGQGRSGRPSLESCTLEQMADDVAALCGKLRIDRAVVFGHSAGGFVAMHMALRHPALVRGLVLCGTSPSVNPVSDDEGDVTPSLSSRAGPEVLSAAELLFKGQITAKTVSEFFEKVGPFYAAPSHGVLAQRLLGLTSMNIEMMSHFMNLIAPSYDLRAELDRIIAPAVVIVGKHDWVCPPKAARAIARGIPNARLVEFEGSRHFTFSEEPELFLETVRAFLRELQDSTGADS
jgi:proline iminopeptidase